MSPLRRLWSVSKKLSTITLITTLLALLITTTALLVNNYFFYQNTQRRKLEVLAEVISNNTQAAVAFRDIPSAEATLAALEAEKRVVLAAIYDNGGKVFAVYRSELMRGEVPADTTQAEAAVLRGGNFKVMRPIVVDEKLLGSIYLEADDADVMAMLKFYLGLSAIVIFLTTMATFLLAHRLQRLVTDPILDLTESAKKVSRDKDYSVRARKKTQDELGDLIDHFNQMLAEIQKRDDSLLTSNKELAESNRDLEQFAYIASHDLQEPLRKIIIFSDRMKENMEDLTPAQRQDFFDRIHRTGHRMRRIIEDLLQFSRVSREDVLYEKVNLREVVDDALSDLELLIAQSHAEIHVGPLQEIEANKSQMHHLLQNLITNSIKFAKKDVPPEIRIDSVSLPGGYVEIRIADNGIGFEEKYCDRIFKPFQRLHAKDEYEGTGIGLAIVEKIVTNHSGHVTAKSHPGIGTTFIVTLPALIDARPSIAV